MAFRLLKNGLSRYKKMPFANAPEANENRKLKPPEYDKPKVSTPKGTIIIHPMG